MVGNVIVKSELFMTTTSVFAPTKKLKLICGGYFEFQKTLKKSPAHLHIVGSVTVKFE